MSKQKTPSEAMLKLREKLFAERDMGNVVFWGLPDELMCAKLDDFVKQPADGILYDLNRSEEVTLQFIDNQKWVNDFAVALTIRKIVAQRDQLSAALAEAVAALRELPSVCVNADARAILAKHK